MSWKLLPIRKQTRAFPFVKERSVQSRWDLIADSPAGLWAQPQLSQHMGSKKTILGFQNPWKAHSCPLPAVWRWIYLKSCVPRVGPLVHQGFHNRDHLAATRILSSWYLHLALPTSTPHTCPAGSLDSSSSTWFLLFTWDIPHLRLTKQSSEQTAKHGPFLRDSLANKYTLAKNKQTETKKQTKKNSEKLYFPHAMITATLKVSYLRAIRRLST